MDKQEKEIIENILKLYFQGELEAKYKIEKRRSEQNHHPSAMDYSGVSSGKTNKISQEIGRFVENKDQAGQMASFLKMMIDDVNDSLETIKDVNNNDDYNVLKWTYSKKVNYTNEEIADKINYTKKTVERKKDKALKRINGLLDLEYYLDNPISDVADFFKNWLIS
jgi:hypothetical protein